MTNTIQTLTDGTVYVSTLTFGEPDPFTLAPETDWEVAASYGEASVTVSEDDMPVGEYDTDREAEAYGEAFWSYLTTGRY